MPSANRSASRTFEAIDISHLLFVFIFAAAAFLRFYHLGDHGFSNDELSAIAGIKEHRFRELLRTIPYDGHPAFTIVCEYFWLKVVPLTEFWLRLPFAIAGLAAIVLLYFIGRRWFGAVTALFAAGIFAVSEFCCLHTFLARPYSLGLFFTLLAAYCLTRILQDRQRSFRMYALYAFALCACAYTHYFSLMQAAIIYSTGLFLVKRDCRIYYLLSGAAAVVLFLPHIQISLAQFSSGGLSWLPKPDKHFLSFFFTIVFDRDSGIWHLVLAALLATFIFFKGWKSLSKFHLMAFVWFAVPFTVGYFYSIYRSPVLQDRALLFALPFALLFLFSFFPQKYMASLAAAGIFAIVLFLRTVFSCDYFHREYYPPLKEIASEIKAYQKIAGSSGTIVAMRLNNPWYLHFYLNQSPAPVSFHYLNPDWPSNEQVRAMADTSASGYFILGYSNTDFDTALVAVVQKRFPVLREQHQHLYAATYFFEKKQAY